MALQSPCMGDDWIWLHRQMRVFLAGPGNRETGNFFLGELQKTYKRRELWAEPWRIFKNFPESKLGKSLPNKGTAKFWAKFSSEQRCKAASQSARSLETQQCPLSPEAVSALTAESFPGPWDLQQWLVQGLKPTQCQNTFAKSNIFICNHISSQWNFHSVTPLTIQIVYIVQEPRKSNFFFLLSNHGNWNERCMLV